MISQLQCRRSEEEPRTLPRAWYEVEYRCIFGDMLTSVFSQESIDLMFAGDPEPWLPEGV